MLFHELYGSYYDVTAAVLREAVSGALTPERLTELVRQKAFSESVLALSPGLRGERWRLLRRDLTTPIQLPPAMPLTTLQKRWLKALLLDPRIRLFEPDTSGLEDVEPLFAPDDIVYFDRYADGDDYADPGYIARFRAILRALRERENLFVRYDGSRGKAMELVLTPHWLEYSEKDDRFRLKASGMKRGWTINLSRLAACAPMSRGERAAPRPGNAGRLTFELKDRRNALERVLLHFSHLRKETERLGEDLYRVTLYYDRQDETELVIRVLAFGPVIRVTEPAHFVQLVKQRIDDQRQLAGFLHGQGGESAVE